LVTVTILYLLRLSPYSGNDRNSDIAGNLFDPIYINPTRLSNVITSIKQQLSILSVLDINLWRFISHNC